ncbi:uncharacterized protein LOC111280924 [Durio zibethinus]|uniref:Uncharacterized protein LOC111280924 n=1 Tax=Durio zibethinus TaxID=66656 RepID=A0A6P5X8R0_DURZI|nr:uncharacterized protein LOC111280924 [Durio zibethinus]XP_022724211.1 uncharacterized protein LOC111280924 [Durio zibethinus]XP_022724222.1 uncharacterized protein LOC111280924 [Durio zibethinus]XP_022724236.1 uncharacterized protein LOC111280924 [Durio zibethinus]
MMSTVGLELTSFINPDLTWKTVSKGNRSGTRRTRKPGAKSLTMGMGLADENAGTVEEVTVSESEKLGVDVLGRRFSEKVENIPIKKRRSMFQSPPLTPLASYQHLEASGRYVDFQPASGQNSGSNSAQRQWLIKSDCFAKSTVSTIDDGNISEVINGVEDFSGIEILAAAACSDCISNDVAENEVNPLVEESTQERIESSASAMCLEETIASLETACCSPKDSVNESKTEGSSFQGNSFVGLHESPCDKDNTTAEKSIRLPDDRLLWDLNLSMDAWPCDGGDVDSQKDAFDNISVRSEELQTKEPQDIQNDATKKVVSSVVDGGNSMTSDLRTMPVGTDDLRREKQESEGCSGYGENKTEHVTVPMFEAENSLMLTSVDTNASIEAVSMDQCLSHSPFPESDKSKWVSEENQEKSLSTDKVELNSVGCISEAEVGKTVCIEVVQVEESDVASPRLPVLEMIANDIQNTSADNDKDHDGDSGLHDVKVFAYGLDNPRPLESLEVEHANVAEEMDICHFSPKSEDMSISDDCVIEAMERTAGASSAYTAQVDSVAHTESVELLQNSSRNSNATLGAGEFSTHEACRIYANGPTSPTSPTSYLDKANPNDTPKESHDSAVCQDKELTVGMRNHSELQTGYDSQFEDGELRESDIQCWEEAEQVDYDTEFEEERSFGLEAESGEQKLKVERGSSSDVTGNFECHETGEALRESSVSLKMRTVEVPDGKTKKIDCLDGSKVRDYDLRVDLSKVSKRELLSRVEGSLSSSRSDNFDGSYTRAEREASSDKFMGRDRSTSHMRGRNPGGGHFFNPSANYWNSKRHHAPIYHGPCNFGRPRPKSVVESRGYPMGTGQAPSEAAGVARPDNRISRQYMDSSNGVYRPLLRGRSPVERDDSYGMHPRMPTVRDTSPDRTRFRRYPHGVSRGIRDEYIRHIPDDSTEYLSRMPRRLGRRERSISPQGGRPHYTVPYKRTRSRSRSRSPSGWLLQMDRNEGTRRSSRSPDFRSDARIDRVRLPFTKRFAAEYEEFITPPRSRISPLRNFRMFEDRNPGLDNFRGRKSPVRMLRQGQRFDQVRPIRRLNSDDNFRPMIRGRRFPDMAAGGKGCKYEGSDDDKHGRRHEMIYRVRRYDTDGAVPRFRSNVEDSYVAKNSLTLTNAIGVSSRRPDDAPRTSSER